jgi:ribonucleoside-diphosphate reductase alpha chain
MEVVKRDGKKEKVSFDKIGNRIRNVLSAPGMKTLTYVDVDSITQGVIAAMHDGISTTELDNITSAIAQPRSLTHPEYGDLAARIAISNYHKNNIYAIRKTVITFESYIKSMPDLDPAILANSSEFRKEANSSRNEDTHDVFIESNLFALTMHALYENVDNLGRAAPLVAPYIIGLVDDPNNRPWIESLIDYTRDYLYDFAGFKLMAQTYLIKELERPQHMLMRVAIGIHCAPVPAPNYHGMLSDSDNPGQWRELAKGYSREFTDAEKHYIQKTYEGLSKHYFTHATPTLFNAGTLTPQLSSCYLTEPPSDSIEGIADWWKNCAQLSKWAGGIGSNIHSLRARGSYIRGTGGTSNGIKPWLKTVDQIAVGVDQGGNKRPGSHAIYLELWHADILEFMEMRKLRGNDEDRARNILYAIWRCDEFMRCLEAGKPWYLMCPNTCPGLSDAYDSKFCDTWVTDEMIAEAPGDFEFTALYRKYVREGKYVREIDPSTIWTTICEVTIETGIPYQANKDHVNRKSNLTGKQVIKNLNLCAEIAQGVNSVCNLISICLPKYVRSDGTFDYDMLREWMPLFVYNLNRIIDINFYPIPEMRESNLRDRPMGIGVQGLADMYTAMRLPFDSDGANDVNFKVFEVIYMEALRESSRIASKDGTYASYSGCPASQGKLQMDLWDTCELDDSNWESVRESIASHGLRNCLLVALMPTGSTSTILGNSPCFEPHNSLVYKRRNKAGEFTMVNKSLIYELLDRGLWTEKIKNQLLGDQCGSLRDVVGIPREIKEIYKTAWDMSPKTVINQALTRGVFVDQTQSMNLFIPKPTVALLTQIHFYGWRRGIKTSSYYTRRLAAVDAQKIQITEEKASGPVCRMEDGCLTCES